MFNVRIQGVGSVICQKERTTQTQRADRNGQRWTKSEKSVAQTQRYRSLGLLNINTDREKGVGG